MRPQIQDVVQVVRGFLMGGADIIPGVSGGTIALVLGIYERLVTAISHVDGQLVRLLLGRQWQAAASYVDLRFVVSLGLGIVLGIGSLAGLMGHLLLHQRNYTLAVFFGLILGSSVIVAKMVRPRGLGTGLGACLLAAGAACFAFWLVGLEQVGFHDSPWYFFGCGAVAICAMILPGISGAYILWLLGAYVVVTGIIHDAIKLQAAPGELLSLGIFAAGCATGLVLFSKLLKWLLAHAHAPVMSILGGFMLGSLRLMWPFQEDLTPTIEKLKLKRYQATLPQQWDAEVTVCLLLAVVAVIGVLGLERWGSGAPAQNNRLAKDASRS